MYCGNCLHDNTLATALSADGHDVLLVPTYTPLKTDEQNVSLNRVFFGGITVYLSEKYPVFRRMPRWLTRWLDAPWLLRLVTSWGLSTQAEDLGQLAVSMVCGEEGHQRRAIDELVDWLAVDVKPDVVHLSNVMLIGMAREIRRRLGVPVLSTLSGEDLFLDQLTEPYTSKCLEAMRQRAAEIEGFVALNRYYADRMSELLQVDRSRFHVIPHGLNLGLHGHRQKPPEDTTLTVGYLGRIVPDKGIHLLAEACSQLAADPQTPPIRLRLAGYLDPADRSYLRKIEKSIRQAGLAGRYDYAGTVNLAEKVAFLQSLDCLVMPTVHPESKGLPVIEALANAVPVVVPQHGAFPEVIEQTGGGLLFEPRSVPSLVEKLRQLALEPNLANNLGTQGQQAVREQFSAGLMSQRTAELYRRMLGQDMLAAPPAVALSGNLNGQQTEQSAKAINSEEAQVPEGVARS